MHITAWVGTCRNLGDTPIAGGQAEDSPSLRRLLTGKWTVTTSPPPARGHTVTVPWWARTTERTIDRPRPADRKSVVEGKSGDLGRRPRRRRRDESEAHAGRKDATRQLHLSQPHTR